MDFIAIDFETANSKNDSPCSLGISIVKNNVIEKCLSFLINPEQPFSTQNTRIHGITADDVCNSPTFPHVWKQVNQLFMHYPVVIHNVSFDKSVLEKVAYKYKIELPHITYYCTLELSKWNFPQLGSYALDAVCSYLNIDLKNHHCCDDDSCAAANIMIKLSENESAEIFTHGEAPQTCYTNYKSEQTYKKAPQKSHYEMMFTDPDYENAHTTFDDNESITFNQHIFVITGDFIEYSRTELQSLIERHGGSCCSAVSGKTDYLIVGLQNKNLIKDSAEAKSSKIIKAENLREKGGKIKIISDKFFLNSLEVSTNV